MTRQFPWVRAFWESLTKDQQLDVASKANAIRKFSTTEGARNRALELLSQLCATYTTIDNDCGFVLSVPGIRDVSIIPCSDLEFLQNYFAQFPDMVAEQKAKEQAAASGKRYRLHNDYWGDIIGIVVRESPSSLYFKCYRGEDVVMDSWRLSRDSNRILGEVE